MTSNETSIHFYLNILEISGKQITNTYVNDLRNYMDKKGIKKYKFEIVTDEDFYVTDKHTMHGGNTTFPYVHFERVFNTLGNMVSDNNDPSSSLISSPSSDFNIDNKAYGNIEPGNASINNNDNPDELNQSNDTNHRTTMSNTIADTLLVYNPLDLNDKPDTKKHSTPHANLDIPNDYNGVIHVLLTIYVSNGENIVQGGITQLNHFLHTKNN